MWRDKKNKNSKPIMVKCLNIGKNIGKPIYRSISKKRCRFAHSYFLYSCTFPNLSSTPNTHKHTNFPMQTHTEAHTLWLTQSGFPCGYSAKLAVWLWWRNGKRTQNRVTGWRREQLTAVHLSCLSRHTHRRSHHTLPPGRNRTKHNVPFSH